MKNFKKFIKEAHLGNPLNEEDRATRVDKMMSGEYDDEDYKDSKRYDDVRADLDEEIDDEDIVIYDGEEHIIMSRDGNMIYIRPLEDSAILGKRDVIKVPARALAYKSDLDKMYDEYKPKDEVNEVDEKWDKIARDEYGKPWMELSIAQKQEMLSYANRETEKQFQTDYEKRRRGDYSDDREDGMTDYQRRRMDEEFKKGDKVTYLGNPGEITFVGKDQMDRTYYSVSYDKGRGRTKASNLYNKGGEIKAVNEDINESVTPSTRVTYIASPAPRKMLAKELEDLFGDDYRNIVTEFQDDGGYESVLMFNLTDSDIERIEDEIGDVLIGEYSLKKVKDIQEDINDPVLMRTRAAQMKRDAMDKKDLENKSKRISVDKAIDLRYELSILDREREDILRRIEDIGVEMDQTAEPEGGPIADKLGERLMAAERELRAIDSKIIDIKDDLGVFDMNESVNENTLGDLVKKYGKDLINFVIGIDDISEKEIEGIIKKYGSDSFIEYLDDRIQIHLEEPEIRQKYLPEGTCGYGEDGVIGDKPAGPDLNENEIPLWLTDNREFEKAVIVSTSYNDFEKRAYGILGPKYFKLLLSQSPGVLKDYYDSIRVTRPSMEEAFDLDIDDAHGGEGELDNAVARMGYNESLKKSLKESLNKRLGK